MWLIEGEDRISAIIYFFEFTAQCFGSKHNDIEFILGEGGTRFSESIWNKQLSKEDVMSIARKVQPEIQSHTQHLRTALVLFKAALFADGISEFYEAILSVPIGEYEKAVETLKRAMDIADEGLRQDSVISTLLDSAEIRRLTGQNKESAAYSVNGLFNEALSLHENADTEKGRNEECFGLAQMTQASGNYEQAKVLYKKNLSAYPDSSHWHRGFAATACKARKLQDLYQFYQGSEEARLRLALSGVLVEFGQYEEAKSILEKGWKGLLFMSLDHDARIAFQQRIYTSTIRDPAGALHRASCDVCYDSTGIRVYPQAPHLRKLKDIMQQPLREWLRDLTTKLDLSTTEMNSRVDDAKQQHPEFGTGSLITWTEWHYLSSRPYMNIFASGAKSLA
ncbi:hypothetical protein DL764_005590 [Monosporascus ibericus]|uniref:Tetratricopeptide repeat protein n=1 Tax=Monosporascus ibericus TaxID=155417 RepID=A0A4Q4TBZ3_9PEZI|nr:hypothetical protein DL764_005590 [Monosporascus ibericus]